MTAGWVLLVPDRSDEQRVRRWVTDAHTAGRPVTSITADPVEALALLVNGAVAGVLLCHGPWQLEPAGIVDLNSVPAAPGGQRRPVRMRPAWTVPPAEERPEITWGGERSARRPGISWPGGGGQ